MSLTAVSCWNVIADGVVPFLFGYVRTVMSLINMNIIMIKTLLEPAPPYVGTKHFKIL